MKLPIVQIVRRPGILELGWGHPDPGLLPVEALQRASTAAFKRYGSAALEYGHPAGPGPLIEWLSARIQEFEGRAPAPNEIMITGGNSLALDQILTLATQPGDTILVESPTYHLAVRIMRDHPLNLVAVPSDNQGMQVDLLPALVAGLRTRGQTVRALYTVPTFNNPTGISLEANRRRALVQYAAAEKILILEDDVYRELAYDLPAPPSLWSLAPPGVVARIGSFSKSLAPGVRVGWLTAGADLITRIVDGGMLDSGGSINHLTALMVSEFCEGRDFDSQVHRLQDAYRERRNALAEGLNEFLPAGCTWIIPGGGFFLWVVLPPHVSAEAALPRAEAEGVAYMPGPRFYLDKQGQNSLRLAFTLYSPVELREGARRLGRALAGLV